MIRLDLPLTEESVRKLHVGDKLSVSGTIVTARDAGHKLMVEQDRPDLKELLAGTLIYHCGPVVRKGQGPNEWHIVAAGPTTSIREEPYQGTVLERYQVRGVIGKGGMGPQTLEACRRVGAVYLHAVGGSAVYLAQKITRVRDVRLLQELGVPEAFWVLEVKNFPVVVTMDSHGDSLHDQIMAASVAQQNELYARE